MKYSRRILRRNSVQGDVRPYTYDLPVYRQPLHAQLVVTKKRSIPHIVKVGVMSVAVLFAGVSYIGWRSLNVATPTYALPQNIIAETSEILSTEYEKDVSGYTNVLMMGALGGKEKGAELTDTMYILRFNADKQKVKIVILPKDLLVQMPNPYYGAEQPLNTVYSSGKYNYLGRADVSSTDATARQKGFEAIDKVLQDQLGIDVQYNVLIDYTSFARAIDSVGGVEVTAEKRLVDRQLARQYGHGATLASAGANTLSGKDAILFVRSYGGDRTEQKDSARAQRQLQVLSSYAAKVQTKGLLQDPKHMLELLQGFGSTFYTDIKPGEAYGLMKATHSDQITYNGVSLYNISDPTNPLQRVQKGTRSMLKVKDTPTSPDPLRSYVQKILRDDMPQTGEFAILPYR